MLLVRSLFLLASLNITLKSHAITGEEIKSYTNKAVYSFLQLNTNDQKRYAYPLLRVVDRVFYGNFSSEQNELINNYDTQLLFKVHMINWLTQKTNKYKPTNNFQLENHEQVFLTKNSITKAINNKEYSKARHLALSLFKNSPPSGFSSMLYIARRETQKGRNIDNYVTGILQTINKYEDNPYSDTLFYELAIHCNILRLTKVCKPFDIIERTRTPINNSSYFEIYQLTYEYDSSYVLSNIDEIISPLARIDLLIRLSQIESNEDILYAINTRLRDELNSPSLLPKQSLQIILRVLESHLYQ